MQLHTLTRTTKRKFKKIVGRGGKRGTYSGRGIKGQKARAGHRIRPEIRDLLRKIPKRRGEGLQSLHSIGQKSAPVNLIKITTSFSSGDLVTPEVLLSKKLVRRYNGKIPTVKILGTGTIDFPVTISGCVISESARKKIEKVGGKIVMQ